MDDEQTVGGACYPSGLSMLHQLPVHVLIPAQHVPGLQRVVLALDVRNGPAGFAHHDLPGGDVPGLQVAFPVAVEAAGGDEGEVEGGGAEAAEAGDLVLHRGHFLQRQLMIAAADMRQAAGDHAFIEPSAAGDARAAGR